MPTTVPDNQKRNEHIHDCTGPDSRCVCGYVFKVARFMVSIDVFDNEAKGELVNDHFGTDSAWGVARALRRAAEKLEGR